MNTINGFTRDAMRPLLTATVFSAVVLALASVATAQLNVSLSDLEGLGKSFDVPEDPTPGAIQRLVIQILDGSWVQEQQAFLTDLDPSGLQVLSDRIQFFNLPTVPPLPSPAVVVFDSDDEQGNLPPPRRTDLHTTASGPEQQPLRMLLDAIDLRSAALLPVQIEAIMVSDLNFGQPGSLPPTLSDKIFLRVIPEPSSMALLAFGAIGLVGYVWRRRASVA